MEAPVTNKYIADKLKEVAKQRANKGEKFPAAAFNKAANIVLKHPTPITSYAEAIKCDGIGKKIASAIDEILKTKQLECLTNKSELDKTLDLFTSIWGFGPAMAHKLYDKNYRTIEDLRNAVKSKELTLTHAQTIGLDHFEDFNEKMDSVTVESILLLIQTIMDDIIVKIAGNTAEYYNITCEIVGSYRRCVNKATEFSSKDVDLLIYSRSEAGDKIIHKILDMLRVELAQLGVEILSCGELQMFVAMEVEKWRRVDIFIAKSDEYACAMLAHTGSKDHNIFLRNLAIKNGLLLNEKGLFDKNNQQINTKDEDDIYRILNLIPVKPWHRK